MDSKSQDLKYRLEVSTAQTNTSSAFEVHVSQPPQALNSSPFSPVIVVQASTAVVFSKNACAKLQHSRLVGASTGKPTELQGDALAAAKKAKKVTSKSAFAMRQRDPQLVDASTGEPTALQGDALVTAKKSKTVISKNLYAQRQLVDASTGMPTELQGDALIEAQNAKTVISKTAFAKRQLVDASTGMPTELQGDALVAAKKSKK